MDSGSGDMPSLERLMIDFMRRADEDRRAGFVLSLAALSLLVDTGIATTEQAVARIERVHDALPEQQRTKRLEQLVRTAQDFLTGRAAAQAAKRPWTPAVIAGGREVEDDQG